MSRVRISSPAPFLYPTQSDKVQQTFAYQGFCAMRCPICSDSVLSNPRHLEGTSGSIKWNLAKEMPPMKLTNLQCKNVKPKEKSYKLSASRDLYLEIMPTGSKY